MLELIQKDYKVICLFQFEDSHKKFLRRKIQGLLRLYLENLTSAKEIVFKMIVLIFVNRVFKMIVLIFVNSLYLK